jgi:hypothetical protein
MIAVCLPAAWMRTRLLEKPVTREQLPTRSTAAPVEQKSWDAIAPGTSPSFRIRSTG